MDGIVRCLHAIGGYQRMAYLKIASVYLVCLHPLNAMCLDSSQSIKFNERRSSQ
jgi:hypothetical protein